MRAEKVEKMSKPDENGTKKQPTTSGLAQRRRDVRI